MCRIRALGNTNGHSRGLTWAAAANRGWAMSTVYCNTTSMLPIAEMASLCEGAEFSAYPSNGDVSKYGPDHMFCNSLVG